MKKLTLILVATIAMVLASATATAQQPLTGEKYFTGTWKINIEMAPPEVSILLNFYRNDKNIFVGSISGFDGSVTMLEAVKVEGNILKASITAPEMGVINFKFEKKDENTLNGDIMDGSTTITCTRQITAK